MFKGKKIKLVVPDVVYSKSYLVAAEEFAEENKFTKAFLITRIDQIERTALNSGISDFHKKIVIPSINPFGEAKKAFAFWIVANNQYIGEIYIKDNSFDSSFIKNKAHPQYKWNEIYNDDIKRYTTVSLIIRPSARNYHNLILITCLLHQKLSDLGFDEFIMNCYKSDKSLNYKFYRMSNICGGQMFETEKVVDYIFPVRPEAMKNAVKERLLTDFLNTPQSFESFLRGLKDQLAEEDAAQKEQFLKEINENKITFSDFLSDLKIRIEESKITYN